MENLLEDKKLQIKIHIMFVGKENMVNRLPKQN